MRLPPPSGQPIDTRGGRRGSRACAGCLAASGGTGRNLPAELARARYFRALPYDIPSRSRGRVLVFGAHRFERDVAAATAAVLRPFVRLWELVATNRGAIGDLALVSVKR